MHSRNDQRLPATIVAIKQRNGWMVIFDLLDLFLPLSPAWVSVDNNSYSLTVVWTNLGVERVYPVAIDMVPTRGITPDAHLIKTGLSLVYNIQNGNR